LPFHECANNQFDRVNEPARKLGPISRAAQPFEYFGIENKS
jgi:hypothetical protein